MSVINQWGGAQPGGMVVDADRWQETIPEREWQLTQPVLDTLRERQIPFALAGGIAYSAYSGRWRYTKDIDLVILPEDRDASVEIVTAHGFDDYYDRLAYDRSWIYRGYQEGVIIDLIWSMANQRAEVDAGWLTRGATLRVSGYSLPLMPVEELIWSKLYVVQRDRCDWPDLLNVIHNVGGDVDWEHLLRRVGSDYRLLSALVSMFSWICPARAADLPGWLWRRLGIQEPPGDVVCPHAHRRASLLDSRDWFGPNAGEQEAEQC